ncbi:hypothetical protein HNQ79_001562 [Streptomyces candidus]|uniref:Uncharacterized protein n=1 Tax=Streptomyces candidus TaxID=67283 RepID=A0A7X0HCI4_9ACTN|nr:hypothetical protein [Streptomyces candidus]
MILNAGAGPRTCCGPEACGAVGRSVSAQAIAALVNGALGRGVGLVR